MKNSHKNKRRVFVNGGIDVIRFMLTVFVVCCMFVFCTASIEAKTSMELRKCRCVVYEEKTKKWSDPDIVGAKKLKVKCSNRKIVKISKKNGNLLFYGKKLGKTRITLEILRKGGRRVKYIIYITVRNEEKEVRKKAKKAFVIQNQYRKAKGRAALKWSEELYRFAQYRIKTSGFDSHKNLLKDQKDFFGDFRENNPFFVSENLHVGQTTAKLAMRSWKGSAGHYKNLLKKEYVIGAIACYGDVWCAVFMKRSFEDIRANLTLKVRIKRYDNISGSYVGDSRIVYYEDNRKWETMKMITISSAEGKVLFLDVGKTYVFVEKDSPAGCNKAEPVTVTIAEDNPKEIVLSS